MIIIYRFNNHDFFEIIGKMYSNWNFSENLNLIEKWCLLIDFLGKGFNVVLLKTINSYCRLKAGDSNCT